MRILLLIAMLFSGVLAGCSHNHDRGDRYGYYRQDGHHRYYRDRDRDLWRDSDRQRRIYYEAHRPDFEMRHRRY